MHRTSLLAAIAASACFYAGSAQAGISRAWVSGHGSDVSGCGAPSNPCRSFQYVINSIINPGGEIDVLDPAGYGAMTIPFALSIINDGVGTAGVQATSGAAITISAGVNDLVRFRGLTIEGVNFGATTGIQINSAFGVYVSDTTIFGFNTYGVNFTPTASAPNISRLYMKNCAIQYGGSSNGGHVNVTPNAKAFAEFENVSMVNSSGFGINVDSSGGFEVHTSISDSDIHDVGGYGVRATNTSGTGVSLVIIRRSHIHETGTAAISSNGQNSFVFLNSNDVELNNVGLTTSNGGTINSVGNNFVSGNTTNGAPTATTAPE